MSQRTVGRVITEAGIKVRLQLGHELACAKALCLSSDGTSHQNIKYEDLDHALDHTSQSQFDGWDLNNAKIIDLYINSPLGRRDTLEGHAYKADDMWRKVIAYNLDHAADVVSAAYKSKDRKIGVIEKDIGRKRLEGCATYTASSLPGAPRFPPLAYCWLDQKLLAGGHVSVLEEGWKMEKQTMCCGAGEEFRDEQQVRQSRYRVWWGMGEKRDRRVHNNMAGYMSLIPTDSTPCLGVVAYISDHTETSSVDIWERQDVWMDWEMRLNSWTFPMKLMPLGGLLKGYTKLTRFDNPSGSGMSYAKRVMIWTVLTPTPYLPKTTADSDSNVVAGCCKHKDHNCTKAGVADMEGVYEQLGLTPPVLLANKDNAATIALGNEADSAVVKRVLKASQWGGYKVVSICGDLFRHKDDKHGHQDLYRHVFSKVKLDATSEHLTVKFPDTSNNRHGTHLAGAAELVTYHAAYIQFLRLIRDTKKTPGLNPMEENALKGLQDEEAMCELIVMTVYKNAVPDAYCKTILNPIEKLIANTGLLLDLLSYSEDVTPDGEPFPDEYAMDCVHYWLRRFSREFHAGGAIDSLTPAEKLLISIPPTNDTNELILGGWRVYSRTRGGTVKHFSAQAAYHRNNTEAFADAKLNTEEDVLYVMRLARTEDASGAMKKFCNDLLAFKARVADKARRKQVEKQAEAAEELLRLQSIIMITDPAALKALLVKLDVCRMLWKDEVLAKTKLGDMSKKADMLAAILAADQRRASNASIVDFTSCN
ncbi:hypothetical protein DFH08DRAFT_812692 [Mycena albidolilacea]|uniref:Uncharacterized protein n=1 Tax=Mycena albidolilacea TaxID=1033008 RepID=A0AAD7EM89_9AGAR|nr:hypothetical protein DFH08DRAFT_812692 [Mycena albidolilacea]